ncbi:MAG: OmpH family outer membrane protein [Terriglobales bacterium]
MTRKLVTIIFAVFVLGLAALAQAPAAPATPPTTGAAPATTGPAPTKIGIVNIQAAIMATNEGQRDFQALEKKFEPKRNELQAQSGELEKLKNQLQTQGDKLNDTARADLVKNIEAKQKTLQRAFEDAQADWTSQQNEIANRIGQKMLEVLEKYATSNAYAVVLDVSTQQSPVLWASAATNITKPLVDAYNAQSGVPAPATTAAAPAKPAAPPATNKKP